MATNGPYSKAPPDKANKLFEKLLATSDGAVKTRERLVQDLKEELELLARLQEEHLFSVLRRHGMLDLLRDATKDNEDTATQLAELEGMPKNSSEFLGQVAELRKTFQQHLRDDRKELLPAVLQVLSDEEAQAVAEKVEEDMASIDETRRADARRSREQAETVQRVTEDVAETLRAGVEGAQTMARAMQKAMESGLEAITNLTRRSTGQAMQVLGRSGGDAQGLTEEASHNLRAVAHSGTALARGFQDVSREVLERSQRRLQRNLEALNALAHCRSMTDLIEVQASLLRDNLELTMENNRRIAELTIQITDEVTRTVTVQAKKTAEQVRQVA
ncbi:phasin family protein [Microvirga calopogonii]|uniref:phasin family protein n=1 Tax=Microvirga calopogonii TaxID=2078013 RepID=UPI000E0E00A1|nr:phasin family protein [Microvirga calopogonii]